MAGERNVGIRKPTISAGQSFGRLTVLRMIDGRNRKYECQCICGNTITVFGYSLNKGNTKSCGCLRRMPVKHGHSKQNEKSPTYRTWVSMHSRCSNPSIKAYARYGARGISVCDRWKDFCAFLQDMGEKPRGLSLDRINNDGNYEPGNCRWATVHEQARNRSNTKKITFQGETLCLSDWARRAGKDPSNFGAMLKRHGVAETFKRTALATE